MEINIRPAIAEDCPAMMELIRELALYERAPEEVTVSMDEFLDACFGSQSTWRAFVAEHQVQIIGMSLYYSRYSNCIGRRLYLEDLIVTESFRGQGVGKLLLDRSIAVTKERKYSC